MNAYELLETVQDRYREAATVSHGRPCDRRQDERVEVGRIPATIFLGGDEVAVGLRDLSISGAQVVDAPVQTELGDTIVLVAPLGSAGLLVIACDIVHVKPAGATNILGLQFIAQRDVDLDTIRNFIIEVQNRRIPIQPQPV